LDYVFFLSEGSAHVLLRRLTVGMMLPVQALRSPLLAAAISHLQHAAATLPWTVRVASVQALAKARLHYTLC
jgi:hypothetical protein